MQQKQPKTPNGGSPFERERPAPVSELAELRETCRRQQLVIDTLRGAVADFDSGADDTGADATRDGRYEARLALDAKAPAAARRVIERWLRERVPDPVVRTAQLLVSELVTNSVRHSGGTSEDAVVVRIHFTSRTFRLEVADGGGVLEIAPRAPSVETAGGYGLNIVHTLSDRWGIEHDPRGGTSVWAQLPRATAAAREPV